jgi:signal recognition particle subunit SRP54
MFFYPDRMASRILGLGDVATLAEQAKKAFDTDTSAKLEAKFASGEDFTLEDFLDQLQAMSKMGNMSKLLGMLPGAGQMKKQIENFDEGEIVRTKAIVQSMTPTERRDPKVLNGSRRARIALGSGRKVSDVNNLVDRFTRCAEDDEAGPKWWDASWNATGNGNASHAKGQYCGQQEEEVQIWKPR